MKLLDLLFVKPVPPSKPIGCSDSNHMFRNAPAKDAKCACGKWTWYIYCKRKDGVW